ncbi:MAG: RNA polymerase factor sigma-54, partial [Proteobacteria bacterium]|nr:RNA polymerase factor sigma-54 [Pseudomonadota bacterium]
MKQALQLRLGQHLTMTPQLQQAIRLLQLSTLELQTEIQEALDANPMLEVEEDTETDAASADTSTNNGDDGSITEPSAAGESDIPEDLPVDSTWDDIYDNIASPASSASNTTDNRDFEPVGAAGESLQAHLRWQMQLTPFSETDRAIAEFIIDSISDDGYLAISTADIHQALVEELGIEEDEVEAVLHRIQNFDPPGVGARDLRESLLLQLRQLPSDVDWREKAQELVESHFDLLAHREYGQLARRLKVGEAELAEIMQLITSLNPRPGSQITA